MNIILISFDADPPYMGGTATVTNILAKGFMARGHFCALGYMDNSDHPSVFFKNKIKLVRENRQNAVAFFEKYKFDIILNHLAISTDFDFLLSLPLGNVKLISAYHNRPMLHFQLKNILVRIYSESDNLAYKLYTLAKFTLLPLYWIKFRLSELQKLKNMATNCDKILVLSEKFYPVWLHLVPATDKKKLVAIGNPLVYENSLHESEILQKEKIVITVCTINNQKRAHLMLTIWKEIENDNLYNDWKFEFIGGGEGYIQLKKLAKKLKLRRISFKGYTDSLPYYRKASIYLMTSKFEGWPMVLMEGQQMGVVPIVYNSFESITDIVENNVNGIIVENNNQEEFVHKLKNLITDTERRNKMAVNAIQMSKRFSLDNVIDKYMNLFDNLVRN